MLEITVADAHAEQSAARDVGHHAHLLIAGGFVGVVPHVAVRLEAVKHIVEAVADKIDPLRDEPQEQKRRDDRADRQQNGFDVARTHKHDEQKGDEEDQRRSEVAHQREQAHTDDRKDDKLYQIALGLQFIERTGADKNKYRLDKFRGLERNGADIHPVGGAVCDPAEHDTRREQQHREYHHGKTNLVAPVGVLNEFDNHAVQNDADGSRNQLHISRPFHLPHQHHYADARQKQSQRLQLKVNAPERKVRNRKEAPFHSSQRRKENHGRIDVGAVVPEHRLHRHKEVEHGDHKHQLPRLNGRLVADLGEKPAGTQRRIEVVAAPQLIFGVADGDNIVHQHLRPAVDAHAVDKGARQRADVRHKPACLSPQEHAMIARDREVVDDNIAGLASADGILPKNNGDHAARFGIIERDERLFGTAAAAHCRIALVDNDDRQQRHDHTQTDHARVINDGNIKQEATLLIFEIAIHIR